MGCHNPILVAPGDADSVKTVIKWKNTTARYFPPSKESELTVIKLYDYQQLSLQKFALTYLLPLLLPRKRNRPKGILSHISFVFFRGKKRYFSLKNVKYKQLCFLSICWNDASKANLHTENEVTFIVDKKKTQGKAITKFSPHVFKRPTFKGSNDI